MLIDEIIHTIGIDRLLFGLDPLPDRAPGSDSPSPPRPLTAEWLALAPQRKNEPHPILDVVLLKGLIPEDLRESLFAAGYAGIHALSFALRNRMTYLSLLSHLAATPTGEQELEKLALDDEDWEGDLVTVLAFPWRSFARLPVVGFAAPGAYVMPVEEGFCRAFDAYDLPVCRAPAIEGLFCAEHAAEAWWRSKEPLPAASRQAKMFAFYFAPKNYEQYDEADLAEMVRAFLRKVRTVEYAPDDLVRALSLLGFADKEEVVRAGSAELRRRFLRAAHATHPDKGGEARAFVELRYSYDVLRHMLLGESSR